MRPEAIHYAILLEVLVLGLGGATLALRVLKARFYIFSIPCILSFYYFVQYLLLPVVFTGVLEIPVFSLLMLQYERFEHAYEPHLILMISLGLASFLVGYGLTKRLPMPRRYLAIAARPWSPGKTVTVASAVLLSIILFRALKIALGLPFNAEHYHNLTGNVYLGYLFMPGYLSLAVLIILQINAHNALRDNLPNRRFHVMVFRVFFFFIMSCALISRSRYLTFAPLVSYFVVRQIYFPISSKRILAYFLAAALAVSIVKNVVRGGEESQEGGVVLTGVSEILGRIAMTHVLSAVVHYTEEFAHGESFLVYFKELHPALGKNIEIDYRIVNGNEFGQYYGFVSPSDYVTGIAIPLVADFYINFGYPGILGGLLFLGCLYAFFHRFSHDYPRDFGTLLFGYFFPFFLFGFEKQFGLLMANFTVGMVYMTVLHLLVRQGKQPAPTSVCKGSQAHGR